MGQIVHGQHHRDMEHLPGEHVHVAGDDALSHRLVEHPEVNAAVAVQCAFRLPGGAPGVEDEQRIGVAHLG